MRKLIRASLRTGMNVTPLEMGRITVNIPDALLARADVARGPLGRSWFFARGAEVFLALVELRRPEVHEGVHEG